jgi:hypothetical protein
MGILSKNPAAPAVKREAEEEWGKLIRSRMNAGAKNGPP